MLRTNQRRAIVHRNSWSRGVMPVHLAAAKKMVMLHTCYKQEKNDSEENDEQDLHHSEQPWILLIFIDFVPILRHVLYSRHPKAWHWTRDSYDPRFARHRQMVSEIADSPYRHAFWTDAAPRVTDVGSEIEMNPLAYMALGMSMEPASTR